MSTANKQSELLQKAVVSLEKKLQEKASALSDVQQERDGLLQERGRWEREREELAAAAADAAHLRRDAEAKDSELRHLRARAEELEAARGELQAQADELGAAKARLAAQLEQWRADREAAEVGCIRAQSQQQVQQALAEQLEATNEALRLELREQATKLQQAYAREAELLSEIGHLKEAQRSCQKATDPAPEAASCAPAASAAAGAAAAREQPPGASAGPCGVDHDARRLDALHRDLFLTAAQHLLLEYSAKVAQAEGRAACLGTRLQQAESRFGQLAAHTRALREQLGQAAGQCRREEQAVQALLASNMRLHESMLQLMERSAEAARDAQQPSRAVPAQRGSSRQYQKATQASLGKQAQQAAAPPGPQETECRAAASAPQQDCGRGSSCCCGCCEPGVLKAAATPAATPRQAVRRQLGVAQDAAALGCCARRSRSLVSSRQSAAPGDAAADLGASGGAGNGAQPGSAQHADTAREAAVDAALAISVEYKELHKYYEAVMAEVRRVGSVLAVACGPAVVQQLRQQHSELQRELWDVAEQLEVKVSQLTALKHAGLL